jgi:hypothetical protein
MIKKRKKLAHSIIMCKMKQMMNFLIQKSDSPTTK